MGTLSTGSRRILGWIFVTVAVLCCMAWTRSFSSPTVLDVRGSRREQLVFHSMDGYVLVGRGVIEQETFTPSAGPDSASMHVIRSNVNEALSIPYYVIVPFLFCVAGMLLLRRTKSKVDSSGEKV